VFTILRQWRTVLAAAVTAVAAFLCCGCSDYGVGGALDRKFGNSGGNTPPSVVYGELAYDGQTYKTVKIGGQTWMAENLNYKTGSGSWCYRNEADSCAKYGRLYTWAAAKDACPAGWKLPSRDDWDSLAKSVGGTKFAGNNTLSDWLDAGKKLKAASGWNEDGNGTDDYGFSAMPGGGRYTGTAVSFKDAGNYGFWWTITDNRSDGGVYYRYMSNYSAGMGEFSGDADNGSSVRCVKN